MSSRLATICLIPVVSLALLANRSVRESYNLQPQYETGQELAMFTDVEFTFEIADAQLQMGPQAMPEFMAGDAEIAFSRAADETVLEAHEGSLSKLRLKVTTDSKSVEAEGSIMGQTQSFSDDKSSDKLGHTFELTLGEDGEVEVVDVTEDPDMEKLGDDEIQGMELEHHFGFLLPKETVEVGDSWDLADAGQELFQQKIRKEENDEEKLAEIQALLGLLEDSSDFEFTGTLTSVEEGFAVVHWSMEGALDSLDMVTLLDTVGVLDEMPQPIPEGTEITFSATLELTGEGKFDLEAHQLTEFSFEGEYTLTVDGGVSADGNDVEMTIECEGTIEFKGGVDVQ